MANEVVAHYLDGRVVKGVSHDIDPARPTCHIRTPDRQSIEVKLADIADNMDLRRIPEPSPKDLARIEKYRQARLLLQSD